MANLLVTGGAGFIGANFVHHWTRHHPNDLVVVLDALTYAGNYQNLAALEKHPKFKFVRGNILDQHLVEDLLRSRQLNVIVNFAAESHVDRSIFSPDAFFKTNIEGTHSLLAAARNVWLDREQHAHHCHFHHLSTVEVYGSMTATAAPFSENRPYAPSSPFAASKAAADHLVRAYQGTYGLPITISNSPNNFGRFHFPDKLIPMVITHILEDKPLPIHGDGLQIRDWLYVQDHCRGIEKILQKGKVGETYHISAGHESSNIKVVEFICDYMDRLFARSEKYRLIHPRATHAARGCCRELVVSVQDRPGHDRRSALDASKIRHELGWRPRYDFQGALEYTIGWYLRHSSWLSGVLSEKIEMPIYLPTDDITSQKTISLQQR